MPDEGLYLLPQPQVLGKREVSIAIEKYVCSIIHISLRQNVDIMQRRMVFEPAFNTTADFVETQGPFSRPPLCVLEIYI